MKCLAINTAGKILSIAVVDDNGSVLSVFEAPERRNQGNNLVGHINNVLEDASISFKDIDLMAVVTGPGSFTGIRVGISAMRGFALATKIPVIGVDAFEMFTKAVEDKVNIVVIESWREELYFAFKDYNGANISEPINISPKELQIYLDENKLSDKEFIITGDAVEKLEEILPSAEFIDCTNVSAVDVAKLAISKKQSGDAIEKPTPYYLRSADITVSRKMQRTIGE